MSKTSFVRLRWLAYAVIAGALLTLLSCSEDKPNEPDEPDQYVELSDTTQLLADTTLALLSSVEDSVLAFTRSNPQLDEVSVSHIIICGISDKTPYGLLGRVTHVSAGHDSLIVTRATLEEAIENCRINFSRELSPPDVDSVSSLKGVRTQMATDTGVYAFRLALDNVVLFDADGLENTTEDQVVANGAVSFNLVVVGDIKINWFKLKYFLFKIDAEENAQLDIDARVNIVDVYIARSLRTYYFAPFAIGPVVFTPKIDVRVGLEGEVSVSATAVVTQTSTLEAGITYEHGDWSLISDFSARFDYDMPAVPSEAAIKAWAGPQLSLLIYGLVGPYAEADAYLRLDAYLAPQLAWTLYGGLEARVGAEVEVLGYTMVDYHATPIQYEKELASGTASENPIHFADPNLEAVIREKINKPSGDIYPSDVAGIDTLIAGGRRITSLDGIEWLVNLTELWLLGNQISDLAPLSGLTNLRRLFLTHNQISDLEPLSGLTNLTLLWLYVNQISDLAPLSGLTSLTSLALRYNQISDLAPLSALTRLTKLGLSHNQISGLAPLSGLTSLDMLFLGHNQISDLGPLSGLTSLTVLGLRSNQISDLGPLSGLTSLTNLDLWVNQISDLYPLVENEGLAAGDKVDVRNNPLSDTSISEYIPVLIARGVDVSY